MAKVKIEITQKGVFYSAGEGQPEKELPVGTVLELNEEPKWHNKFRVLSSTKGKTLETGGKKKIDKNKEEAEDEGEGGEGKVDGGVDQF